MLPNIPINADRYLSLAMQLGECKAYGRGSKPTPATQRRVKLFEEETNTTPIPRPRDVHPESQMAAPSPIVASIALGASTSSSSLSLASVNSVPTQVASKLNSNDAACREVHSMGLTSEQHSGVHDANASSKRALSNSSGHEPDARHHHKRHNNRQGTSAPNREQNMAFGPIGRAAQTLSCLRTLNYTELESSLCFGEYDANKATAGSSHGYNDQAQVLLHDPPLNPASESHTSYMFQAPRRAPPMEQWIELRRQHDEIPKDMGSNYRLWWASCSEFILHEILFTCYAQCHSENLQNMLAGWLDQSVSKFLDVMFGETDTDGFLASLDGRLRTIGFSTMRLLSESGHPHDEHYICLPEILGVDAVGSVIENAIVESGVDEGQFVSHLDYENSHALFQAAIAVVFTTALSTKIWQRSNEH
jgi:hypothetical protein